METLEKNPSKCNEEQYTAADYRFGVKSGHQQMGELIRLWAKQPQRRPCCLADLKEQCDAKGIDLEIGKDVTEVNFFDMPYNHSANIYIPPAELIDQALPQGQYPLPDFYKEAFEGDLQIDDKDSFKLSRIGEYTTQKCL